MPLYRIPILPFAILVLLGAVSFPALGLINHHRGVFLLRRFWPAYAAFQVALAGVIFYSHLSFPLNLEFMESTGLQHVMRLSAGQLIYVEPSPDFVALSYNPLFYEVAVPFVRFFGPSLLAVRLPAILGTLAAAAMVRLFVRKHARSRWWAWIGVGVFAAAYRVMDCYFDVGHRDSLLLFSILTGFWFLDSGGRFGAVLGMLALATGFWFKQTGAMFLMLGACYVLWQFPWRRGLIAIAAGLALGPVLYILAPATWWGPRLHYFTFEVPSHWTAFQWSEASNLARLLVWHYGVLLLAAGWLWMRAWRKKTGSLGVLRIAIPGALASSVAIMMTPGSANNVYMPAGTLLVVAGTIALAKLSRAGKPGRRLAYSGLAFVFAVLMYNPVSVIPSARVPAAYAEFIGVLRALDGPVYGPGLGPVGSQSGGAGLHLTPLVHVVPMADMVRGRGRDETNVPVVRSLLRTVENPASPVAYIVAHSKLEDEPTLAYLAARYRLEKDFGRRFESLATLPGRHGHLYPRYLYRSIQPGVPGSPLQGGLQ